MSNRSISLTDSIYQYLLSVSLRELPVQHELRQETAKLDSRAMQIAPEQGQFMALLVELLGARKTLEVGVYTGYSALSVALALPRDGRIIACDINEDWTRLAKSYWQKAGVNEKIDLRLAPAIETLDNLLAKREAGNFDFAFIDADKVNYDAYYEKCLTLIRRGGLIAIDNTLWDGALADLTVRDKDTIALRNLNLKLLKDDRVTISLVPIGDGLTLARKR